MSFGYSIDSVLKKLQSAKGAITEFCFDMCVAQIEGRASYALLAASSIFATSAAIKAIEYVAGLDLSLTELEDAATELENLSLIVRKADRVVLLPLTISMTKAELEKQPALLARCRSRYMLYYSEFVEKMLGKEFWRSEDHWRRFPEIDGEIANIIQAIDMSYQDVLWQWLLSLTVPLVHYLHSRGLFEERLRQARLAIRAAGELSRPEVECFMLIASVGWIHIRRGQWEEAEKQIEQGLELAKQIDFLDGIALAHAHLARIALAQDQIDEAKTLLDQVEDMQLSPDIKCRVYFCQGLLEAKCQNWSQSEVYLRLAINTLLSCTDFLWPALYMALGDTLLSEGKLDKAEQVFRQSLAFSNEMSRKTDTADAWFGLARIARMRGDVKRAAEMAQTALYLFERYRSRAEVDQVATFIIGLEKPKPLFPAWLIRKGR